MKLLKIVLTLFMSISLVACHKEDQTEAFLEFINQYIINEVTNDYTTLHTYFENPEDYGIDVSKVEISLGERFNDETYEDDQKELKELKKEFDTFDRNNLDNNAKKIYDDFKINLDQSIELSIRINGSIISIRNWYSNCYS